MGNVEMYGEMKLTFQLKEMKLTFTKLLPIINNSFVPCVNFGNM